MNICNTINAERHATWLELFFDLVFIVAISALSHTFLAHNLSWRACGFFVFLFLPIWWLWMQFSYYIDQFELKHHWQRVFFFITMFTILSLAVALPNVLHHRIIPFAALYLFLQILIVLLYAIAWVTHHAERPLLSRYTIGFTIAAIIWGFSLLVSTPACFVLWGCALLISIATPIVSYFTIREVPVQISHMDERFGLFTLIVLGDTIVSVALGIKNFHWLWTGLFNCMAGFVVAIIMWASYFDAADTNLVYQALLDGKPAMRWSFLYGYSHFFVFVSIVAFGVGVYAMVMPKSVPLHVVGALLFASAFVYLIGTFCIGAAVAKSFMHSQTLIKLSAGILIGLGALLTWHHLTHWAIPAVALILLIAKVAKIITIEKVN